MYCFYESYIVVDFYVVSQPDMFCAYGMFLRVKKKDLKRKQVSGYLDHRKKGLLELWGKSMEEINSFQDRYTLFAPSDHPQAPKVLLSFPFIVHCILSIGSEFVALL